MSSRWILVRWNLPIATNGVGGGTWPKARVTMSLRLRHTEKQFKLTLRMTSHTPNLESYSNAWANYRKPSPNIGGHPLSTSRP